MIVVEGNAVVSQKERLFSSLISGTSGWHLMNAWCNFQTTLCFSFLGCEMGPLIGLTSWNVPHDLMGALRRILYILYLKRALEQCLARVMDIIVYCYFYKPLLKTN